MRRQARVVSCVGGNAAVVFFGSGVYALVK